MQNTIPIPQYTQVPNIAIDYWMLHLSHVELKVFLFIIRKTLGWHKTIDRISLSQIQKGTGSARNRVSNALQFLIEKGLVRKETYGENGNEKVFYEPVFSEIKPDDTGIDPIPPQYPNDTGNQYPSDTPPSIHPIPTKETLRKEKGKKGLNKVAPSPEALELKDLFLSFLQKMNPKIKEAKEWLNDFDKLLRIDGHTKEETIELLKWISEHKFWKTVILSPSKLREKYCELMIKFKMEGQKTNKDINREFVEKQKQENLSLLSHIYLTKDYLINPRAGTGQREVYLDMHPEAFKSHFMRVCEVEDA